MGARKGGSGSRFMLVNSLTARGPTNGQGGEGDVAGPAGATLWGLLISTRAAATALVTVTNGDGTVDLFPARVSANDNAPAWIGFGPRGFTVDSTWRIKTSDVLCTAELSYTEA